MIQNNLQAGIAIYNIKCMGCHRKNFGGAGLAPSLKGLGKKFNEVTFKQFISEERGMMPSFNQLSASEKTALASFVLGIKSKQKEKFSQKDSTNPYYEMPYTQRIEKFLSNEGLPATAPPWGTLNAVNLNSGKLEWRTPLGDMCDEYFPQLKGKGISGTENFGGSIVTAGGLVFIGATPDKKFRAFDKFSGTLLWEAELPAAAYATPASYEIKGKQYVVIACGGGGHLQTSRGDAYIAFSLADDN